MANLIIVGSLENIKHKACWWGKAGITLIFNEILVDIVVIWNGILFLTC